MKNALDADGSLALVQSKKNSSDILRPFASNFLYNAAGAVTAMRLGNGRWENTEFNSRLQPTKIGLGSGVASQSLLKLEYSYGTTANNGNVVSQTITVPGLSNPFVQSYSYDELNRISTATETNNSVQTWQQAFSYDRYGNRNFVEANTTTLPKNCGTSPNYAVCSADVPIVNPAVSTTNNRFSSGQGYSYDSSGNTTGDAESRTFVYDAENKQVSVSDTNGTIGQYVYDGDGKRIKKIVPGGETTVFVYDASGKLIGEYSTVVQTGNDAKTVYTTSDNLGSPRINTDGTGTVVSRHDYHPFGEEISTTVRTSNLGYSAGAVRKKFTGYERDNELGLDYAKARYYGYSNGRFSSPDDFLKDTKPIEPSSWNLYVYVRNNPLKYIDSSGESVDGTGLSDEERMRLIAEFARVTGYRVEDLSFGSNGLLAIASGARSSGGSSTARRLLNEAINSSWEFVLVGVNTTDVAFAEHAPTLKPSIVRPDGSRVSGGVYGQVRIDFADFNNAVFENDQGRETFSLGITVLHEFVHGLYPEDQSGGLSDHRGGGAGEIENNWINPIRRELGLATRDVYSANPTTFTNPQGQSVQGVQLSFTRYEYGPLQEPTFRNPFPEEGTYPVTTHVYWQLNTVGGKRR